MTTAGARVAMQPASPPQRPAAQPARRRLVVVGASGGVGTSTVAAVLGAVDGGVWQPDLLEEWLRQRGPLPWPDVVVTGVSVQATDRARRLFGEVLVKVGVRPLLAVVSDGRGRPPADARAVLTMLRPLVRGRVDIPYVPAWRECTSPRGLSTPPRDALAAVNRLRALCGLPPVSNPRRKSR